MPKTGTFEICLVCGSEFYVAPWWKKKGGGNYCSRACGYKSGKFTGRTAWNFGKKMPFAHHKMPPGFMPVMAFKKGQVPWNKGKEMPKIRDDKNVNWKGDSVGYYGVHDWVRVRLGTPSKCEMCGTTENRTYHWANKSGKYKRKLEDWMRLCVPCHKKHDQSAKKAWVTRKRNAELSKNSDRSIPNSRQHTRRVWFKSIQKNGGG